jgi:hypothetical protein
VASGDIRHPFVQVDPQNRQAAPGQSHADLAGAAPDVEHSRWVQSCKIVEERLRVRRAVAIVLLCYRTEGPGPLTIQVKLTCAHTERIRATILDVPEPLGRADADRIASFLDACADTDQADVCFIFGTRLAEPAYIAARAFREGVIPCVVVTGGFNRVNGVNEAEQHLSILLEQGVPRGRILVENQSTNTADNVALGIQRIAEYCELDRLKSLLAVTKWYHSRRALMTLKRYMPDGLRYYTKCYEPRGVTRRDWYTKDESTRVVLREWEIIPKYLAGGGIEAVHEVDGGFE